MFISRRNNLEDDLDISLRDLLNQFIEQNGLKDSAIAEEIGIHKETLSKFLKNESDLKFMHAIRLMKLLNINESQLVAAYCKGISKEEEDSLDKSERISYIMQNFDIQGLKKIGVIKSRAKIDEYEDSICHFFGFSSIYEYDDTTLLPSLFSKCKARIAREKEAKMTTFWLKCAISSFNQINNTAEYNKELLFELLKRAAEFTRDEQNGYRRFILVLAQLGITVITQSYITGTNTFGVTMILNGKPCIVVTDMKKKYHKLWITLLHELYHVVNDYELLESAQYHISSSDTPDLLFNEQKADQFAYNLLINPSIQQNLSRIVSFPAKVDALAKELGISSSIIYGVYLETLPDGPNKSKEFAKYKLISSDVATQEILVHHGKQVPLKEAIVKFKEELKQII